MACDGDWVVQEEGENDGEGKAGDGEEGGAARDRPAVKRVDGGGAVGGVGGGGAGGTPEVAWAGEGDGEKAGLGASHVGVGGKRITSTAAEYVAATSAWRSWAREHKARRAWLGAVRSGRTRGRSRRRRGPPRALPTGASASLGEFLCDSRHPSQVRKLTDGLLAQGPLHTSQSYWC